MPVFRSRNQSSGNGERPQPPVGGEQADPAESPAREDAAGPEPEASEATAPVDPGGADARNAVPVAAGDANRPPQAEGRPPAAAGATKKADPSPQRRAPSAVTPPAAAQPTGVPRQRSLLGEINASIDQAGSRTENRMLRGLMALDEKLNTRLHSTENAIGTVLQDHARTLEMIRQEMAETSDQTKERMELLEERMYETLSTFIAVLQQIRAELSILSDSIKALETETSLTKRATSGGPN